MTVEWRENEGHWSAYVGDVLILWAHVLPAGEGVLASILGSDSVIWESEHETLDAAKSAAITEARRLLREALAQARRGEGARAMTEPKLLTPQQIKEIKAKIEEHKKAIASHCDALREIRDDLDDILEPCDNVDDLLRQAIDELAEVTWRDREHG